MRWTVVVLAVSLAGCQKTQDAPTDAGGPTTTAAAEPSPTANRGRTRPVCATQDCTTHAIIDNGCSDDGRCISCVMACPADIPSSR